MIKIIQLITKKKIINLKNNINLLKTQNVEVILNQFKKLNPINMKLNINKKKTEKNTQNKKKNNKKKKIN